MKSFFHLYFAIFSDITSSSSSFVINASLQTWGHCPCIQGNTCSFKADFYKHIDKLLEKKNCIQMPLSYSKYECLSVIKMAFLV